MACQTPDDHPPVESWEPGRGVHATTRRDCCWPYPFPPDGVYPTSPSPVDLNDSD